MRSPDPVVRFDASKERVFVIRLTDPRDADGADDQEARSRRPVPKPKEICAIAKIMTHRTIRRGEGSDVNLAAFDQFRM
jgi:hypothetical protein